MSQRSRRPLRQRGVNSASLAFVRERDETGIPGASLSYTELKQRYGQLLPAEAPRSIRKWPFILLVTFGALALYALHSG